MLIYAENYESGSMCLDVQASGHIGWIDFMSDIVPKDTAYDRQELSEAIAQSLYSPKLVFFTTLLRFRMYFVEDLLSYDWKYCAYFRSAGVLAVGTSKTHCFPTTG